MRQPALASCLSEHFYQPLGARLAPNDSSQAENALAKRFFFEKRTKKLLFLSTRRRINRDSDIKVFCFFSSEKKAFLQ
jgi:hypothetical protein